MLRRLQEMRLVVAHRGGGKFEENRIAGLSKGVERGCRLLECDVRLSRDERAVVVHDALLTGYEQGRANICSVSRTSARELEAHHGVPSLDSVVAWMCRPEQTAREVCLAIEVKDVNRAFRPFDNARLVADVVATLVHYDAADRCMVVSFDTGVLEEARKRMPRLLTGYLCGPEWTRRCPVDTCVSNRTDNLWVHHELLNVYLMKKAMANGIQLYVWTVNDEQDIMRVLKNDLFESCVNRHGRAGPREFMHRCFGFSNRVNVSKQVNRYARFNIFEVCFYMTRNHLKRFQDTT
jgi:glycerophosphoryl diester phosphodiesterase